MGWDSSFHWLDFLRVAHLNTGGSWLCNCHRSQACGGRHLLFQGLLNTIVKYRNSPATWGWPPQGRTQKSQISSLTVERTQPVWWTHVRLWFRREQLEARGLHGDLTLLVTVTAKLFAIKSGHCEVGSLARKSHPWVESSSQQLWHQFQKTVRLETPFLVSPASKEF